MRYPLFLSVVCVVHDWADQLEPVLRRLGDLLDQTVTDHEIVLVDNASTDGSVAELRRLTGEGGLANLQVYALTQEVDAATANWAGLENALGDLVAVVDLGNDDVSVLPEMVRRAVDGADVVFAVNDRPPSWRWSYRLGRRGFDRLYGMFGGINLGQEAPGYRVLSRLVVTHVLQHPQPAVSYRLLPATGGFVREYVHYSAAPLVPPRGSFWAGVDRGTQVIVSTTRAPLRVVTGLTLFGALANVLYAIYVLVTGLVRDDVEPGWISVSLQQSGMFFLLSLVLLVIGEYVLNMASSNASPRYRLGQEFTSVHISSRERLNVEEVLADREGDAGAVPPPRIT